MAIAKVSDNNTRYHMSELHIMQGIIDDENLDPDYSLSFVLKEYTVDVDGVRTYTGTTLDEYVDGFYQIALADYLASDPTHMNALGTVQLTIAKFIEDNLGIPVVVV